jgi:ankyrin repeat protein
VARLGRLLSEGVSPEDESGIERLLHLAARHNQAAAAELLLQCGAEVNGRKSSYSLDTPLHGVGGPEAAAVLLRHGADPLARDDTGRTPLHYVKDLQVAWLLLRYDADVNAKSDQGATPLHEAIATDNGMLIEFLLSQGAEINARHELGSPLDWAVMWGHQDMATLLRKHGAVQLTHAPPSPWSGFSARTMGAREPWPHRFGS